MAIRYSLLITANPFTDSLAAKSIFKAVKRLDILSEDIDIFLPGFHSNKNVGKDNEDEVASKISMMKAEAKLSEPDYPVEDPTYHVYCESAGDMYFNDVDFCKFMTDMEKACPNLEYIGRTELVILPSERGKILYNNTRSFNLEPFVSGYINGCSLEQFLLSVLRILKKKKELQHLEFLSEIEKLYCDKVGYSQDTNTTEVTIRIDNAILEHMRWSGNKERCFLSYSTKNKGDAYALRDRLKAAGKDVWMAPEGIPAGFDYLCVLPAAVRITSRFIVLLSKDSASSGWVRREIEKAVKTHRRIDGVLTDGFSVNDIEQYEALDFLLSPVQIRYTINDLLEDENSLEDFIK